MQPEYQAKADIAAFFLQGKEAVFIHHLTLLGAKYGYKPIGNEYDGLLTIGLIPEEAVNEARELSGFVSASLDMKAFTPFKPLNVSLGGLRSA